ncbi:MAG TPA: hypothetical protein VGE39_03140 [Prosthecobacter sp.]
MNPTYENWRQWADKCAFELCDTGGAAAMRSFVYHRFRLCVKDPSNVDRAKVRPVSGTQVPPIQDACQEFEAHIHEARLRRRPVKQNMLARYGRGGLNDLEAGVSLRVRETARRWLRQNGQPVPITDEYNELGIEAVVAGTGDQDPHADQDWQEEAAHVLKHLHHKLTERQWKALALTEAGIKLNQPEAVKFIGLGKSQAYTQVAEVKTLLKSWIWSSQAFSHHSEGEKQRLTVRTFRLAMETALKVWKKQISPLLADAENLPAPPISSGKNPGPAL